jgi:hypothetical protein
MLFRLFVCCFAVLPVAAAATPEAALAKPKVALEQTSAASGTVVSIRGTGFRAHKRVTIKLGRRTLARLRASRHGAVKRSLKLPRCGDSMQPGRYEVRVRAGSALLVLKCLLVRTSPSPAPVTSLSDPIVPVPEPSPAPPPPPAPTPQPSFPIRAAFYYPWFPEAWSQKNPITNVQISPFTEYHPSLGFYNSEDDAVRLAHLKALEYAGFQAGIYSWWGQGHNTDKRLPGMLSLTDATRSPIKWALYYEREGTTDPAVEQIGSDLDYIKTNYASDPAFLKVDGKPVLFVYGGGTDDCTMADRWAQANTPERNFYVVLKVFAGYRLCTSQPQGWHQYAPSSRTDRQRGYSFAISPGFHRTGDPPDSGRPYLARDLAAFQQAATDMVASGEPWQLVISFNEWGENTATESAEEWASASGYGQYLDALDTLAAL